ncbi:transcriptional regulator with XRE-family HTH domain [Aequitasia blattaphilus]|uniref:Helix-turn-helix domain-containing protein n=1 Tax=Aequitasia blattaphilus TaxID=2949332 RepID=A0ABT1EC80_9FIRM|nr:helix-turn-helix transcriptional regulator [Aequitasia blattaphilus]MCP1103435.1 helix-turn-helix domain-containing protein [Aequitasia blattaphilus]MCR8616075.1 helix-turn-helix domain-containing protein [Aequitasia blattaphilus]
MRLGKVIRKYRKSKDMTQEEMAKRLGVTAPAVNKWENDNSFPDITLLAPIARLLEVSLDTLLSFQEDLTDEEINEIIQEADIKFKEEPYEEVFLWVKKKIEEYPNCEVLIMQMAELLDAQRIMQEVPNAERYDDYICDLFIQGLKSGREAIRIESAHALIRFHLIKKEYGKAEEYLEYLSQQNPQKKEIQAHIYAETERVEEAWRAYEELLYSSYQQASTSLQGMYRLSLKNEDMEKAHQLVEKQEALARCFEMGKYHEISCGLEVATIEKDKESLLAIMEGMLSSVEQIDGFTDSFLYEHMNLQKVGRDFLEKLKADLLGCFRDEEHYGFLKNDERWKKLKE